MASRSKSIEGATVRMTGLCVVGVSARTVRARGVEKVPYSYSRS